MAGACAIGGLYQVGGQNEGWVADENPDGSWNPLIQPISNLVNAGGEGQISGVSCGGSVLLRRGWLLRGNVTFRPSASAAKKLTVTK